MKASELKRLQTRARDIRVELSALAIEAEERLKRNNQLVAELEEINQAIKKLCDKKPVITEHAMLRYLQRVHGVDLSLIEDEILTERNVEMIRFAGTGNIKCGGYTLVVQDGKVITVKG